MAINDKMYEEFNRDGGIPHTPQCNGEHKDGGDCIAVGVYQVDAGDLPHKIVQICLGRFLQVQFTMDLEEEGSVEEIAHILKKLDEAEKHHTGPTIMSIFGYAAEEEERRMDLINALNEAFGWGPKQN